MIRLNDDNNKLKNALRQLVGGVAITVLIPLSIWMLVAHGPVASTFGTILGYIAAMAIIPGLVMGFRGLAALFDLLFERFHLHLSGKNLLIGAALCVFGTGALCATGTGDEEQIFLVLGAAMLIGGLWVLGKAVRTAFILRKDGETVHAVITQITHDTPNKTGMTYTVYCRAGDQIFDKRTDMPLDASFIGKKVAVFVSASRKDVYYVDLSKFFPPDPETGETSAPGAKPEIGPDTADGSTEPIRTVTPEEDRTQKKTVFTPVDWETIKKRCLKIPYGRIILLTAFLLYDIFVINRLVKTYELSPLFYLFTPVLAGWLLAVVWNQVRRYLFFRYGRQVRAQIRSSKFANRDRSGDSVYMVTCAAGDGEYSGDITLHLEDPALTGKWVTVFVSRRNPKQYTIAGSTVGGEY